MSKETETEELVKYMQEVQEVAMRLMLEAPILTKGDSMGACAALILAAGMATGMSEQKKEDADLLFSHFYEIGLKERVAFDQTGKAFGALVTGLDAEAEAATPAPEPTNTPKSDDTVN